MLAKTSVQPLHLWRLDISFREQARSHRFGVQPNNLRSFRAARLIVRQCYDAPHSPLRIAPRTMDYRKPSDRKSMHSRIVQDIGMQIVSGRFKPDDKLPAEALLCEEYAVSRPVLREATRVLVAKGLVYSRPRVGTVVKPRREWHILDPDVLHWLMQSSPQNEFFALLTSVRSIIEPAAAALAAQHATPEDLTAISEAYERMAAAPTVEDVLQPDLDFHSRIADATHNDLLAHLCNMLSLALREALKHSNKRPNLHELALPRHRAILTAIENRDALGAHHATLVQLDDARNALNVVLGKGVKL